MNRRTVLRGLLGGAAVGVGLPALDVFVNGNGTAWANGDAFPRRFGLFWWGNGNLPERFVPGGEGTSWTLSEQLAPLAAVKDRVTVVTGLALHTDNLVPHNSGAAGLLTGMNLLSSGTDHTFAGPSVDQVIAAAIGGDTVFRSIEFGAGATYGGQSHLGPHAILPAERDPYRLFDRVFGSGFVRPDGGVDPRLALRRSVLDAVMADAEAVRSKVGARDRVRLEQHLEGVRELELRLARLELDPPNPAACEVPSAPSASFPDVDGRPALAAKNQALCDIVAMAVACDQVRVFSNWFTEPVSNLLFTGATSGHHQLTHDEPGDQPQVHAIVLQVMAEFARFVAALDAIPEGDGTVLDACAVLATSEVSLGRTHSGRDLPIVLAGSAGGRLAQGVHLRTTGEENVSKLMLTLIRAMGIAQPAWGVGNARATDGLAGLET